MAGVSDYRSCSLFDIRVKVDIDMKTGNGDIYLDDEKFINNDSISVDEMNLDGKILVDSDSDAVNEDSGTNSDLISDINSATDSDTDNDIDNDTDSDSDID